MPGNLVGCGLLVGFLYGWAARPALSPIPTPARVDVDVTTLEVRSTAEPVPA